LRSSAISDSPDRWPENVRRAIRFKQFRVLVGRRNGGCYRCFSRTESAKPRLRLVPIAVSSSVPVSDDALCGGERLAMRPAFARAFCDEASVASGRLGQSCSRSWSSGVCAAGGVAYREHIPLVLHVVNVAIGVQAASWRRTGLSPSSRIGGFFDPAPVADQRVGRKGLHYRGWLGMLAVAIRGGGCGGNWSLSCWIRSLSSGSGWV
jgi:hypothetical protein